MSRFLITVNGNADREKAARWCMAAKLGMRIEFKQAKRSGEQNDKLWAMLTEVSEQVQWHGIKLSPDDWKFIFLDALKRELRVVPNIDGNGFVNLGRSSSDLSKDEMSNLIELIHAFGANHGVTFHDPDSNSVEMSPHSQPDAPADEAPPTPPSSAGNQQEESSVSRASDDSGAGGAVGEIGDTPSAPEVSGLSPDWQETYLLAMKRVNDRPKSLLNRHNEALQLIGGKANAAEREWMTAVYQLTSRKLKGEIAPAEYDEAVRQI